MDESDAERAARELRESADTVERYRCPVCGEWLPIEMEGAQCGGVGQHVFIVRPRRIVQEVPTEAPLPRIPRDAVVARARLALRVIGLALLLLTIFVATMLAVKLLGGMR